MEYLEYTYILLCVLIGVTFFFKKFERFHKIAYMGVFVLSVLVNIETIEFSSLIFVLLLLLGIEIVCKEDIHKNIKIEKSTTKYLVIVNIVISSLVFLYILRTGQGYMNVSVDKVLFILVLLLIAIIYILTSKRNQT